MSEFGTPWWFAVLIPVVALAVAYVWAQRRNHRRVLRFTNLDMLDRVAPRRAGWWRHLPAVLFALALVMLTIGLAGPTAEARVPRNRGTVLLVVDVSLSMQATDIEPSRLAAAQQAATRFARQLPPAVNMGVESFSGAPAVLVNPTTDRGPAVQQINALQLGPATATGEALATALSSLDNFNHQVPAPPGTGPPPARIVLMSDGKQTVGRDEYAVAREASHRKIPISTISFGTEHGTVDVDGQQLEVPTDDPSLSQVAKLSGGAFFRAPSNADLHSVYDTLNEQIGYEKRQVDVSKTWFVLGTLTALAALASSLALGQRLPG